MQIQGQYKLAVPEAAALPNQRQLHVLCATLFRPKSQESVIIFGFLTA